MPGATLVELEGVGVRVGPTPILRDVELRLLAGEAIGLFGPNGAGKTTLLRLMATLLPPSDGSGVVLGADLAVPDRYDVRRSIGFVGHVPSLYGELTLIENLDFAAKVAGSPNGNSRRALEAVGLAGAAERRADACSHGMQRRAEFARELMLGRDLLLLDEPHSALDEDAVELVASLVAAVTARGGGAVLASHDRDRVEAMVDRSVELKSGTLI
jgi:heme ABC exporter ATP-binding subunit CcmA